MRKSILWTLLLVFGLSLVLVGCGQETENKEEPKEEVVAEKADTEEADGSWERVKEKGEIVAGLDDGFPPMGYRNEEGELVGFDIEMAKEISERIGVEIKWQPTDWNGIVPSLLSKKFDVIISGMNMWESRKEVVNFAGPYGAVSQIIMVKKDSTEKIETVEDLKGKPIGTQLGGTAEKELRKAGFDEDTMKLYNKFPEAFADLDNGRLVAVVVDSYAYREWEKTGKYIKTGEPIGVSKQATIGIAVRKDDKELLNKLNEAIESMKEDGTLKELSEKWIGFDMTEQLE